MGCLNSLVALIGPFSACCKDPSLLILQPSPPPWDLRVKARSKADDDEKSRLRPTAQGKEKWRETDRDRGREKETDKIGNTEEEWEPGELETEINN